MRNKTRANSSVKGGGGRVRRVLYLAALSILRSKSPLRSRYERLVAQDRARMWAIGVLMRRLLLMARAIVKSGAYDPVRLGA